MWLSSTNSLRSCRSSKIGWCLQKTKVRLGGQSKWLSVKLNAKISHLNSVSRFAEALENRTLFTVQYNTACNWVIKQPSVISNYTSTEDMIEWENLQPPTVYKRCKGATIVKSNYGSAFLSEEDYRHSTSHISQAYHS